MLSSVFSTTMATMRARWLPILGATFASMLLVMIVGAVLLLPAYKDIAGLSAGAVQQAGTQVPAQPVVIGDSITSGTPVEIPAGQDPFGNVGAASGAAASPEAPGIGLILKLVVAMVLIYLLAIAASSSGVFAAAGLGVKESIIEGARTTPHAVVQTLKIAWPAMAAYGAGIAALLLVPGAGKLLAIPLYLAGMVLGLRVLGTTMLAVGSIAHGHVSYDPSAAREAAEGRRWNATGVALVGVIVSGIVNIIPFAGTIFMSAYLSAMWEEYGDGTPPRTADALTPDAGSTGAGAQYAPAAGVAAPHVAVAAVAAAPAAAAPQLVAGPTWNGVATPQQPCGAWVTIAGPANVGLQVQWTSGEAPAVMVADQAGVWTTPAAQPTTPGEAVWLELPAGNSWVALMPRGAEGQQVWAATWLPSGVAAAA
ncbi:MAG: hypothetical protein JWM86_1979 [Thermoleophilia bacterium]|nr:hypothetical protein [Thermoleophilia bacterium]